MRLLKKVTPCGDIVEKIILTPNRKNYSHNALSRDVKRIVIIEDMFKTKIPHFLSHLTIKFY